MISRTYRREGSSAGGARRVETASGRLLGLITRRFRPATIGSTTKVSAWRFEPVEGVGLSDRYFAAELGERSMLLRLRDYIRATIGEEV